jgi:hypothetical protein
MTVVIPANAFAGLRCPLGFFAPLAVGWKRAA